MTSRSSELCTQPARPTSWGLVRVTLTLTLTLALTLTLTLTLTRYACTTHQLGPSVLQPLGFPPTKLGLRSLVAADRAVGSQRAAAALGRAWHAANALAPIIAPLPPACSGGGGGGGGVGGGGVGGGNAAGSSQSSDDSTRDDSPDATPSGATTLGVTPSGATADGRTLVLVFSSLGWNGVVRRSPTPCTT